MSKMQLNVQQVCEAIALVNIGTAQQREQANEFLTRLEQATDVWTAELIGQLFDAAAQSNGHTLFFATTLLLSAVRRSASGSTLGVSIADQLGTRWQALIEHSTPAASTMRRQCSHQLCTCIAAASMQAGTDYFSSLITHSLSLGSNSLAIIEALSAEVNLCLQSGQQHLHERGESCQQILKTHGGLLLAMLRDVIMSVGHQIDQDPLIDAYQCVQFLSQIKAVSLLQLVAEAPVLQAMVECVATGTDALVAAAADGLESVLERGKWMTFIEQEEQAGRWESVIVTLTAQLLDAVEAQQHQHGANQHSQSYLHSLARVLVSLASADTQLTCTALTALDSEDSSSSSSIGGGDGGGSGSHDGSGAVVMRRLLNMIVVGITADLSSGAAGRVDVSEALSVSAIPLLFLLQFLPHAQRISEPQVLCVHLLPVLVKQALSPYVQQQQQQQQQQQTDLWCSAGDEDELAEWLEYREQYVAEVLSCCCSILGAESYVDQVAVVATPEDLSNGWQHMHVERLLFCLSIPTVARLATAAFRGAAAAEGAALISTDVPIKERGAVCSSVKLSTIFSALLQQYMPQQPQLGLQHLVVVAALCRLVRVYATWCLQQQHSIASLVVEFLPRALAFALPPITSAHLPGYALALVRGEEVQAAAARALVAWSEQRADLLVEAHPQLVNALHPCGGHAAMGAAQQQHTAEGVSEGRIGADGGRGVCAEALFDTVRAIAMTSLAAMTRLVHLSRQGAAVANPRLPLEQLALALRERLLLLPRLVVGGSRSDSSTAAEWLALEQMVVLCSHPPPSSYLAQPSADEAAATATVAAEARVHIHRMIEGMWVTIDAAIQSSLQGSVHDEEACLACLQFCATALRKMDTLWSHPHPQQQTHVALDSGYGAGTLAQIVPPLLHAIILAVVRCHAYTSAHVNGTSSGSALLFSSVHVAALRTLHRGAVQPCLELLQHQRLLGRAMVGVGGNLSAAGAGEAAGEAFIVPLLRGMLESSSMRLHAAAEGAHRSGGVGSAGGGLDLSHPDGRDYLAEYLRMCTRIVFAIRTIHATGAGASAVCPPPLALLGPYAGLSVQYALAALAHESGFVVSAAATPVERAYSASSYSDADPLLAKAAIGLLDTVAMCVGKHSVDGSETTEAAAARALLLQPRAAFGDGQAADTAGAGPLLLLWLPLCGLLANAPGFLGETAALSSLMLSVTTLATTGSGSPSRLDFANTEMQLALHHCAVRLQHCVPPIVIPADVMSVLAAAWGRDNPPLPPPVFERLLVELVCVCKGGTFEADVLARYATEPLAVLEGGARGYDSDY
jgi:hypothetical protein